MKKLSESWLMLNQLTTYVDMTDQDKLLEVKPEIDRLVQRDTFFVPSKA